MPDVRAAVTYLTRHDDWKRILLIGGGLWVVSFLLVPILPAYGYVVRVIRRRLDGDPTPPAFDEWRELFVDGLKAFVIVVAYLLVPGLVAAVTVGGSIAAVTAGTPESAATGVAGVVVGGLVTLLLSLAFGYLAAAALVSFADRGDLGAAFDVDSIKELVFAGEYAVAWGLSVLVFVAASILTSALNVIPFLGAVVGAFVLFYAQVVAAYLWADGVTDARDAGEVAERPGVGESTA